jgi:hypothetical protein
MRHISILGVLLALLALLPGLLPARPSNAALSLPALHYFACPPSTSMHAKIRM